MRWVAVIVAVTLAVAGAVATWAYLSRHELACHWAVARVARATDQEAAEAEIAWFESEPDRQFKLRCLVREWGSGNRQFDLYLARHLSDRCCSDRLREAFLRNSLVRPEVLPRWAHYWVFKATEEPDRQIAEILSYLDLMAAANPPRELAWREVLDLEAIFQLSGEPRCAMRLEPDQWRDRFRHWRQSHSGELPHVARPEREFPEG